MSVLDVLREVYINLSQASTPDACREGAEASDTADSAPAVASALLQDAKSQAGGGSSCSSGGTDGRENTGGTTSAARSHAAAAPAAALPPDGAAAMRVEATAVAAHNGGAAALAAVREVYSPSPSRPTIAAVVAVAEAAAAAASAAQQGDEDGDNSPPASEGSGSSSADDAPSKGAGSRKRLRLMPEIGGTSSRRGGRGGSFSGAGGGSGIGSGKTRAATAPATVASCVAPGGGIEKKRRRRKKDDFYDDEYFVWDEELMTASGTLPAHVEASFATAVFELGLKHSSPKVLMRLMPDTEKLTTEHIKSHLQKYRLHYTRSKDEFLDFFELRLKDRFRNFCAAQGWRNLPPQAAGGGGIGGAGGDDGGEEESDVEEALQGLLNSASVTEIQELSTSIVHEQMQLQQVLQHHIMAQTKLDSQLHEQLAALREETD